MNRFWYLLVLLLQLSAVHTVVAADVKQPNVVFFLVDDLGRNDVGFMGGKEIKTPHVDKLASQGAKLDSFYVQPLCSPTRAAFLTGRYPMRYGLQEGVVRPWAEYGLPLEEKTLAEDLKAAGYETGIFGKWHLGLIAPEYLPTHRGFLHQYGHYNGALDYFKHERDGGLFVQACYGNRCERAHILRGPCAQSNDDLRRIECRGYFCAYAGVIVVSIANK